MPHAAMKLVGGVNTNETATLNEESGISSSNLVRFFYDPNGVSLVQKLGGWTKFYPNAIGAVVRSLWAWEDLEVNSHLAIGTDIVPGQTYSNLEVLTAGTLENITPTQAVSTIYGGTATIIATAGSASIKISDTTNTGITNLNSVYIPVPFSIGSVVIFGSYACDPDGYSASTSYTIFSQDLLGNLLPNTTGGTLPIVPVFYSTAGSSIITVNLPSYTYSVGDTFPILVSTNVGGLTLFGNYVVNSLVDANDFTIIATTQALFDDSVIMNNGNIIFIYSGAASFPSTATPIGVNDWTIDNYGENLIACSPQTNINLSGGIPYQPIYVWSETQPTATVIPAAPPVNDGIFVAMPQRQIVAWGSTQTGIKDPLLINWCDVGNYNQWIALVTNQAGSYRIPKGSRIVGCVQGPQQALIWTDVDVWSMQYIGPPYVYSFNEIGTGCGLIARKAATSVNGIYYWMGPSQFYTLSANGVQPLQCPVWDVVFQNLNTSYLQNIRVAVNSRFNEIQWFYPSSNSSTGENDSYVKYNTELGLWDYGFLGRSAWIDQSILGPPIGADPNTLYLYQHETSNDADGAAMSSFIQTGYFNISEGDLKSFIDWVWPDMKWGQYNQPKAANVQITFFVTDYPGDTPIAYGPYTVNKATEYFYTRFRGRLVSVRIASNDVGSFWRIGLIRYRFAPDGKI